MSINFKRRNGYTLNITIIYTPLIKNDFLNHGRYIFMKYFFYQKFLFFVGDNN